MQGLLRTVEDILLFRAGYFSVCPRNLQGSQGLVYNVARHHFTKCVIDCDRDRVP